MGCPLDRESRTMVTIDESQRELALAAAAKRGDEEAFKAIYEMLSLRVFNLVLRSVHERATAEDVCQDVWVKAHREIQKLESPAALRTWLFRMASRECIDYSRSRACRERKAPEVSEEMLNAPSDEPEKVAERRAELRVMWEALAAMPPRQSLALYLKQAEGFSYDEIGRVLKCPRSAVETLLFRARQGFARTHQQLQNDPQSSCKLISRTMAVVLDHEATQFQERAVEAHVNECRPCRIQMQTMTKSAAGYAWLPMLPAGQQALLAALAAGGGGAGIGIGIGRFVGELLLKAKAASTLAVVVGTVGTTAVAAGAATGVTPTPADVVSLVQESVTGPQDVTVIEDRQDGPRDDQSGSAGSGGPGGGSTPETSGGLPPAGGVDPGSNPNGGGAGGEPGEGLDGTLGGATDTVNTTLDGVTDALNGVIEGVTDAVNTVLDGTTDAVNTVLDGATDTLNGALDGVGDALDGVVDGLLPGDEDAPAELPPVKIPPLELPPLEIPPLELPPLELPPLLPPPDPEDEEPLCIPLPLLPC
jgi:RNA polymerase sigma-70 factor (ECF subfamily)